MKLVENTSEIAARHKGVSAKRRDQIIAFFQGIKVERQQDAVRSFLTNPGPAEEKAFVRELFNLKTAE